MSEVKKVITVAERSTKALIKATGDMRKVAGELEVLAESSAQLTEEIEFKQGQLADVDNQIAAQEREKKAELRLRVIENEDKVLGELMKSRGLASITAVALDTLNSELVAANTENEYAVSEAREAGYNAAASKFGAEIRDLKSQHDVSLAEYKAQAGAKADAGRQGVVVNAGKS